MYNVGIFPGKFLPPHRGHLNSILRAASQCKKFYVIVSDNNDYMNKVCRESDIRPMSLRLRAKWISQELQNIEHIKVLILDETRIPPYPEGTKAWSKLLIEVIPEKFDVIFGGELEYKETYMSNFPGVEYVVHDYKRTRYPVSATKIRKDYLKHWDYILGSARSHFAKRVLITGTESCGKTTLTKMLAKIYHTSWAEEVGRFYSERHLGGNEDIFTSEDFFNITFQQKELDEHALRSANKIAFFDTDAVVTQFYCLMYLGEQNPNIELFVNPDKYDVVFFLSPNVQWVDDGLRWNNEQKTRNYLHSKLLRMYRERGFGSKIVSIAENTYIERFEKAISLVDKLLE